jgi:hypothetical protein
MCSVAQGKSWWCKVPDRSLSTYSGCCTYLHTAACCMGSQWADPIRGGGPSPMRNGALGCGGHSSVISLMGQQMIHRELSHPCWDPL